MRVYLPMSVTDLASLMTSGQCTIPQGYVSPPELAAVLGEDEDAAEFVATSVAAAHCGARGQTPRVVLTAELPDTALSPSTPSPVLPGVPAEVMAVSAVSLAVPVTRADIVCVHVDPPEAAPEGPVDPLEQASSLLWFGPTEISALLATYGAAAT